MAQRFKKINLTNYLSESIDHLENERLKKMIGMLDI